MTNDGLPVSKSANSFDIDNFYRTNPGDAIERVEPALSAPLKKFERLAMDGVPVNLVTALEGVEEPCEGYVPLSKNRFDPVSYQEWVDKLRQTIPTSKLLNEFKPFFPDKSEPQQ